MTTLPTIHLNGTGAETLRDDALKQRNKVEELVRAMLNEKLTDSHPGR